MTLIKSTLSSLFAYYLFSIPVSVANRLEMVQLDLRMEEEKKFNQFTRRLFVHLLSNFKDWD